MSGVAPSLAPCLLVSDRQRLLLDDTADPLRDGRHFYRLEVQLVLLGQKIPGRITRQAVAPTATLTLRIHARNGFCYKNYENVVKFT